MSGSEPARFWEPCESVHRGVVDAELVGREEERGAEALELERPPSCADDVRDSARGEDEERDEADREHAGEAAEADPELARPSPIRGPDERQREKHERVDLRRDREPEQPEAHPLPPPDERSESRDREERRPEVVSREDHRAERERREREEANGRVEPGGARLDRRKRETESHDGRDRAGPHQDLEDGAVVLLLREGGEHERRRAAGGYSRSKSR